MKIFELPDLGEGFPYAVIREWYVKEGDEVSVDQMIVAMETPTALMDVPSSYAGVIVKLHGDVGETIDVYQPLVSFSDQAYEKEREPKPASEKEREPKPASEKEREPNASQSIGVTPAAHRVSPSLFRLWNSSAEEEANDSEEDPRFAPPSSCR